MQIVFRSLKVPMHDKYTKKNIRTYLISNEDKKKHSNTNAYK